MSLNAALICFHVLMSEHLLCLYLLLEECYFHKKRFCNSFQLGGFGGYWLDMESVGLQELLACFREGMLNDFICAWECFANEDISFRNSFK